MAEILGKDLDNYDESLAARQPFSLSESDTTGPQFMTGADLIRSAKISSEWREPVAIRAQAYAPIIKPSQPILSAGYAMVDSLVELPSNVANLVAQGVLESTGRYEPIIDTVSILADKNKREKLRKAFEENQESLDETIKLLSGRDYSVDKWARRVIANSTANVENRKLVRELYNQAKGIDSSKWYNEAGAIIGAMLPTMAVGNTAFATSRAFGAGRVASAKIASNVVKGYIGTEMAGQYAEETAAQYLEKTGDKNFENFTAKDASGLSAAAYGAIGAQIEFMGGVEPIMAGALTKVGLRSAGLKAAAKIGVGEATEELLQGLTEILFRKIEGTTDKTWKEGFEESLKGAAWGLFIGGTMGTTAFHVNRRNLVKGIKTALPNISDTQAQLVADAMIDSTAEISSQDPTLRGNLRQKIDLMYRDVDIENKADRIDAITDLEYSLISMDAAERGIDLAEHELFAGEVNELGWFREGIPEARRAEIQEINDNIVDLKSQLTELNKAQEKDWAKIEEIENKLAQANQYVLEKLSDLARDDAGAVRRILQGVEDKYVEKEKEKSLDSFEASPEQKELASGAASFVADTLANEGFEVQVVGGQGKKRAHGSSYLLIRRPGMSDLKIRIGVTPIGAKHSAVALNLNAEKLSQEEMLNKIRELIKQKFVKSNKATNVNLGFEETSLEQARVSGKGSQTYRGAYIPTYRFILRANRMDASTLSHELAHDWFEVNFDRYRSGKASKEFMRAWGALEKALSVPENATTAPRKASEAFARAYEAWVVQNEDWAKLISVEDKDKDAVEKLLKDYQSDLRDIYNDISNPYFKQTWGRLGELKPELKAWFDRVVNITDLDVLAKRGEMTESQVATEKLNRAIDTVIESTEDAETAQTLKEARTLNDTSRYEAEGGNKNSLQRRLSALAQEIDENNMVVKGEKYDTRRDMMAVAEAADNFVKTRLDDALAIINGQMAEVEGLYKEDLYTALERLAVENGDLGLIDELKNSEVANRLAKELGQRVAGFRNFKQSTDLDVVSALKSLDNKFNEALKNKKAQKEFDSALKLLDDSIKQQDKIADKELETFLEELKCK
ncbi:MAG: hypothetical protein J6S85_19010 [Methanobrevibacter sp.]|nr:hypothetical protein [Methanobrevibacter sp.]